MGKKYELTDETMTLDNGTVLHRIKALVDIDICGRKVKAGDLGGWIEKMYNLSHLDNCWIFDEAKVYGSAKLYDNALVYDNAEIYGDAEVYGNASIFGNAEVFGKAEVFGNAKVYGNAYITGNASIFDDTRVYGYAEKSDKTTFDIYKLIDDCMSKKDRYITIYDGKTNVSITVYPLLDKESED